MDDPQAPPIGTKGTVQGVDDIASIRVHWDNGSQFECCLRKGCMQEDNKMMNLQEILFFRAKAELDAYMDMKKVECYTEEENERQESYLN